MTPARPRREDSEPPVSDLPVSDLPVSDLPVSEPPVSEAAAERLADTMFALSTPSRVQILACLLGGPRSVSDLTEALGMEQSAVSHQLRVLREADLVRAEKDGRKRLYALSDEHVSTLLHAAFHHAGVPHPVPPAAAPARVLPGEAAEGGP
jgi:DNA-binding transcriptional ArsR family regulator